MWFQAEAMPRLLQLQLILWKKVSRVLPRYELTILKFFEYIHWVLDLGSSSNQ